LAGHVPTLWFVAEGLTPSCWTIKERSYHRPLRICSGLLGRQPIVLAPERPFGRPLPASSLVSVAVLARSTHPRFSVTPASDFFPPSPPQLPPPRPRIAPPRMLA